MAKKKETEIQKIDRLWSELSGRPLWQNGLKALENYLGLLGFAAIEEAVFISAEREVSHFDKWRYCCGVLRAKLAEQLEGKETEPR